MDCGDGITFTVIDCSYCPVTCDDSTDFILEQILRAMKAKSEGQLESTLRKCLILKDLMASSPSKCHESLDIRSIQFDWGSRR